MSYSEKEGRAGGEHGAPNDEVLGSGSLNTDSDKPVSVDNGPSFKPTELAKFADTGFELIRLNSPKARDRNGRCIGKAPQKGWRNAFAAISIEEAIEHMEAGCNVGVRLRDCDLVVDVDPRNFAGGSDPLKELGEQLGIDWRDWPRVMTGSGGLHYYMRLPKDELMRETLDGFAGLEFKTFGRQMVAPGSVHPDTGKPYLWDPLSIPLVEMKDAPANLIELLRRPEIKPGDSIGGDYSPEQLEAMLTGLEVSDYRQHDNWLEIMMACHHATAGDGVGEFIAWSIGDPEYAEHEWKIRNRWDSLHADAKGKRVTVKTLFKALHKAGNERLIPKASAADDFADDLASGSGIASKGVIDEWVYVADAEVFVRRSDGKKWKREQWKSFYAGLLPDGDILNAIWKGKLPIRKFEALVYLPGEAEFPDGESGKRYNIWNDSGIEARQGDVSQFLDHIAYLFSDEAEREHVLDYFAMLVQKPGQKINYALLVKGDQGTGKSWTGRLMTRIIGAPNVTTPSNDEVRSNWTGWTEGANLGIIDELMAVGRLDMANRLKPIITEPMLRIENKGFSHYSIPNKLNLMAFTNHDDAVPIEQGDRRWLVVFSDAKPRGETYYEALFAFLDGQGPAAVKHWLLQRDVKLKPKGMAPSTRGKEAMRRLSLGDAEQHLGELLEDRAWPFDFPLFRFEDALEAARAGTSRNSKGLRNALAKWLGNETDAVKHSKYSKAGEINRPNFTLWSIEDHEKWEEAGPAGRIDAFMAHRSRDLADS